ncbi:cysteine-rich receptor-like protein kinase 4 isoform X1 [Cucurbita maxima]|uniref:non-specific serine/threonine protein kinase n=1 Tax=Cucurbita maxima TaxID=3661 RepID=A0A6J1HPF4_CUCMA|nr:cysteine-rich receptor-like protein kinase 4 isoform X1 [Cucurbita maxima]
MVSKPFISALLFFTFLQASKAQPWIKAGYWLSAAGSPSSDINSPLFTHLLCGFAELINSTSYELHFSSSELQNFSNFTAIVKQKNPSLSTLLSIGGGNADYHVLSSMVSNFTHRKAFIDSTIKLARTHDFDGLDFCWVSSNTTSDMSNMGKLFEEWRQAAETEARISKRQVLILTAAVQNTPDLEFGSYPVDSIRNNLNWVNFLGYDYYMPSFWPNFTAPFAALYDPLLNKTNTDSGISQWIAKGLPAANIVLALPFYGYAWTLKNVEDFGVGAAAIGPAISADGSITYKDIKDYMKSNRVDNVEFNGSYVMSFCVVGSTWIGFDDAKVVKIKVNYVKQRRLLGYFVWLVSNDDNWELSSIAASEFGNEKENKVSLLIVIPTTIGGAIVLLLLGFLLFRRLKSNKSKDAGRRSKFNIKNLVGGEDFKNSAPDLQVFSYAEIERATNKFAFMNKLGQGGYGPVYKGVLGNGQEIAVKRLSATSAQGFEEFKNEVLLTARLQHVNLVKVVGFCVDTQEHMLIYEYMPNKSLDFHLFGHGRGNLLNWAKRVEIIEGVTQGLLYLQEYSRLTIIHRDLKPSNILLDDGMKPKISDFGMARIFAKEELEANTSRIAGTYGYIPPEYAKQGVYSTKSDVFSFGVLLLQIISGKRTTELNGEHERLSLLDYAYEAWKEGRGMEFMDQSLDDSESTCKLTRCMQIALLCVQENADDRPTMLEISSMLKSSTSELKDPQRPAFSVKKVRDETDRSLTIDRQTYSVSSEIVTEVAAR